ncbi:MAG TPA: YdcH family protein [Pyrinomonadaceae bacterium]|nr:YdcH family protein [Pyrinomonadaceae bacterium]
MDMSIADPVRDELIKSNQMFRELVHQHQDFEQRLSELAHLTYPNDDEQLEEITLKKKKLAIKDEIYTIMQQHAVSH